MIWVALWFLCSALSCWVIAAARDKLYVWDLTLSVALGPIALAMVLVIIGENVIVWKRKPVQR